MEILHSRLAFSLPLLLLVSCSFVAEDPVPVGQFDVANDLLLAHFDSKTDVDDIHSVAAVSTMLADPRLAGVQYHAVAGAYGTQGGRYIPANELFEAAFGKNWSDAHTNIEQALNEVADIATKTLRQGGDVWIAEAGQSDFSAAVVKVVKVRLPKINSRTRIHIVQHSEWNENNTAPANLAFVKAQTDYNKIPDGNAIGNGTPGLRVNKRENLQQFISSDALLQIWDLAINIANQFNGSEGRYTNVYIKNGGMDFSDTAELCWIFGFEYLSNTREFFEEFSSTSSSTMPQG